MFNRHKHKWKVIEKERQESILEAYSRAGIGISFDGAWPFQLEEMSRNRYVVTYKCEECEEEKVSLV